MNKVTKTELISLKKGDNYVVVMAPWETMAMENAKNLFDACEAIGCGLTVIWLDDMSSVQFLTKETVTINLTKEKYESRLPSGIQETESGSGRADSESSQPQGK